MSGPSHPIPSERAPSTRLIPVTFALFTWLCQGPRHPMPCVHCPFWKDVRTKPLSGERGAGSHVLEGAGAPPVTRASAEASIFSPLAHSRGHFTSVASWRLVCNPSRDPAPVCAFAALLVPALATGRGRGLLLSAPGSRWHPRLCEWLYFFFPCPCFLAVEVQVHHGFLLLWSETQPPAKELRQDGHRRQGLGAGCSLLPAYTCFQAPSASSARCECVCARVCGNAAVCSRLTVADREVTLASPTLVHRYTQVPVSPPHSSVAPPPRPRQPWGTCRPLSAGHSSSCSVPVCRCGGSQVAGTHARPP